MKVCDDCDRVVSDKVEVCPECGSTEFTPIIVPFYNDWEPYLEDKDDSSS